MSKNIEIILSGVGGQGIVVGGALLGQAAVEYGGKNAVSTSEYGVETRGTFTKSSIIIGDGEIYFTESVTPNLVVAMAKIAYDKYINELKAPSVLVYDSSIIQEPKPSECEQIGFPITQIAATLGSEATANIVALGIIVHLTNVLEKTIVEKVLNNKFEDFQDVLAMNIDAFNKGYEISSRRV
ncbi:MAG TPA: 2-oxoacid:acceptor oxidoreductase [Clostridiales bacterium]|jgi:2-oxoglutarate ferredoxin oxidoreductase subunit gamma|nr:2-oxoacid:acceptor oxidoreductase [Clostridiales bacterium]